MANMVGQIGCVTAIVAIIIIAISFGIGWLLDDYMGNERRFMTVILMLASFPVTLYAMVRISLAMVGRAQQTSTAIDNINSDALEQDDEIHEQVANSDNKEDTTA